MAKGYLVVEVEGVTDPKTYESYRSGAGPLLEKHGGKFIVKSMNSGHFVTRDGGGAPMPRTESVEGGWLPPLLAICEFPTYEQACAFYFSEEYQKAVRVQLACAKSRAVLVEGM
jgi:uncharacterized protein (DUF1330 family)